MEDKKDITKFVSDICNKEYKQAQESMHKMVENKLKQRIKQASEQKN